jgi:hypothetical protein
MRDPTLLRNLAGKFRRLAEHASDEATVANLRSLAGEYEEEARRLEPDAGPPMPMPRPD